MTTKTNKRLQQNQSNNLGKLPIWDLGDLYNSSKDKKITLDLNFIKWQRGGFKICILNGLLNSNTGAAEMSPLMGKTTDRCIASNAPILIPQTNVCSQCDDKWANRFSTNSIHSKYEVLLQSLIVVPWPGKFSAIT